MSEIERRGLGSSYQQMTDLDAWKDLEAYIKEQRETSIKLLDDRSPKDLTLGEVCEERGIRKGMLKILSHVESMKSGK